MRSVLVVDPDPAARELMRRQLESRGFTATLASSAEDVLAVLKVSTTSLVGLITNVEIPGMISGWDIARIVREHDPHAAVGYLSMSGHRDWAMLGVPRSIIISGVQGEYEIPEAFFRFCEVDDAQGGTDGGSSRAWQALDDAVHRQQSALAAHFQQSVLAAHLQHTPSLIAVLEGPEHRYTLANDAYLQLVERDVIGKTVAEAFPEVVSQGYLEILGRVYNTGEEFVGHNIDFEMEIEGRTKRALLDLVYRPIHASDGQITGIFVEGMDHTASHAARAQISVLQAELIHIARVNAMGLLASTLAHELNQPLTAISNFLSAAKMIAKSRPVDPSVMERVNDAATSAMRAGGIIRRLRALTTKGLAGRKDVTVESIVEDAIAVAGVGPNVDTACDFSATQMIHGDPIQLQQVVINFIQNAIDAAEGKAEIVVSTADRGEFVECCVRDSGPGIGDDVLARVFDSFVTTKADGMGIGLSLSKTIVENHGGTIMARNNDDRGASFCFTLPAAQ